MTAHLLMSQATINGDRDRWLATRCTGIAASEMATVLGLSPHDSPFGLFVAKQTGKEPGADNDAMARGRHLEPYVAERFAATHDDLDVYLGGLYRHGDRAWQMATFDRLAIDPATEGYRRMAVMNEPAMLADRTVMPVQIKTAISPQHDPNPLYQWGEPGTAEVPVHYRVQALQELDVTGADTVLIPVLFMTSWKYATYAISRDAEVEADLKLMRAAGEEFLDRLERDDPPAIDWTAATTRALKMLHGDIEPRTVTVPESLARRYRNARRAVKRSERQLGLAQNELLHRMGSAKWAFTASGTKVVTRTQANRHSLDTKALADRHPEIAKQFERETPVDALYPSGWSRS